MAVLIAVLILLAASTSFAYAQEDVQVPESTVCFMQDDLGVDIFQRCGLGEDWLAAITVPFDWVLGGYFSLAIVSILCIMTYQKYGKAIYPMIIGIMYLPVAYAVLPPQFLTIGFLLVGSLFGIYIWYTFIRQTKEY